MISAYLMPGPPRRADHGSLGEYISGPLVVFRHLAEPVRFLGETC